MKRRVSVLLLALFILALSGGGCAGKPEEMPVVTRAHEPVPVVTGVLPANRIESPDDIVDTPVSSTYRANVHEQGVPDWWPSIETVEINMVNRWDSIYARYRDNITTKSGEIRNDILSMRKEKGSFLTDLVTVKLYTTGAPPNMTFVQVNEGGLPGTIATLLNISIPEDIKPGSYNFDIDLEIDGLPYGSLPCTIEVTQ
jgi:hypothetical protein